MAVINQAQAFLVVVFLASTSFCLPSNKAAGKNLLCYWGSWAAYRWGDGLVEAYDIDPNTCTHLVYAFAGIDQRTHTIHALDRWNDLGSDETGGGKDNYRNLIALKTQNPTLKVLLSVGGYNQGSSPFSIMARTAAYRTAFTKSVVEFLAKYGFDGLDVNWEWPAAADKANYVALLKELRTAFDKENLILVASAPASIQQADAAFNLPEITKLVDLLSIFAYDYTTDFSHFDHGSPLYAKRNGQLTVDVTISHYLSKGAIPEKLLLGVVLYGRAFLVRDPSKVNIGDSAAGPASPGEFSQQPGILAWVELCSRIKEESEGFTPAVYDEKYQAPYSTNGAEWIAYEDQKSLDTKVKYAQGKGLGGITVWSLENDDMHNRCGKPLVASIRESIDK